MKRSPRSQGARHLLWLALVAGGCENALPPPPQATAAAVSSCRVSVGESGQFACSVATSFDAASGRTTVGFTVAGNERFSLEALRFVLAGAPEAKRYPAADLGDGSSVVLNDNDDQFVADRANEASDLELQLSEVAGAAPTFVLHGSAGATLVNKTDDALFAGVQVTF